MHILFRTTQKKKASKSGKKKKKDKDLTADRYFVIIFMCLWKFGMVKGIVHIFNYCKIMFYTCMTFFFLWKSKGEMSMQLQWIRLSSLNTHTHTHTHTHTNAQLKWSLLYDFCTIFRILEIYEIYKLYEPLYDIHLLLLYGNARIYHRNSYFVFHWRKLYTCLHMNT